MMRWLAVLVGLLAPGSTSAQPTLRVQSATRLDLVVETTEQGIRLEGVLRDDLLQALADREVTIQITEARNVRPTERRLRSARDGRFSLSQPLAKGRYRLRARYAGDGFHVASARAHELEIKPAGANAAPTSRNLTWALLPPFLLAFCWWLLSRRPLHGRAAQRAFAVGSAFSQAQSSPDRRAAALRAYKPAALSVLTSPAQWGRLTPRETLEAAHHNGKGSAALSELTTQVEQAAYARPQPTEDDIAAIAEAAKAVLPHLDSAKGARIPHRR